MMNKGIFASTRICNNCNINAKVKVNMNLLNVLLIKKQKESLAETSFFLLITKNCWQNKCFTTFLISKFS